MAHTARVVVVTGASSGIGRAVAHAFAGRGFRLVLVGRSADALEDTGDECRALGGECVTVVGDMADHAVAELAARTSLKVFGRADIWVNAAAVLSFGRFEDIPPAEFDRLIATNICGYANGARAALGLFRPRSSGVLINIGSMLGVVSEPYASAYVTSKFAIRGLSACLQQELAGYPSIHVCTVLPAAIDTPIYQKAANRFGRKARSIWPVGDPANLGEAVVKLADSPRPELVYGMFAKLLMAGSRAVPQLTKSLVRHAAESLQFEVTVEAETLGNLFESREPQASDGGWRDYWRRRLHGALRRHER